MNRRTFVKAAAAASVAPALSGCGPSENLTPWTAAAFSKTDRSQVAILLADAYDGRLVDTVMRGMQLIGLDVAGKRVVLKPNFVEFDPGSVINTNPVLLSATVEAFRSLGARETVIAEGPGHRRDTEYIVRASGLLDVLRDKSTTYVDLNNDAVRRLVSRSAYTELGHLYLPETVASADLLVSMPKMKTHHWAGATLSMKNLFGIMPGAIYGWPKNVLHFAGIERSILDINATLPIERFNIVDGIVGMEGDGPIMGTPRQSGLLVFGRDPVAVDATTARLMGLEPERMGYIAEAGRFLGNVHADAIEQRGEPITALAQEYALIESMSHLRPSQYAPG